MCFLYVVIKFLSVPDGSVKKEGTQSQDKGSSVMTVDQLLKSVYSDIENTDEIFSLSQGIVDKIVAPAVTSKVAPLFTYYLARQPVVAKASATEALHEVFGPVDICCLRLPLQHGSYVCGARCIVIALHIIQWYRAHILAASKTPQLTHQIQLMKMLADLSYSQADQAQMYHAVGSFLRNRDTDFVHSFPKNRGPPQRTCVNYKLWVKIPQAKQPGKISNINFGIFLWVISCVFVIYHVVYFYGLCGVVYFYGLYHVLHF